MKVIRGSDLVGLFESMDRLKQLTMEIAFDAARRSVRCRLKGAFLVLAGRAVACRSPVELPPGLENTPVNPK